MNQETKTTLYEKAKQHVLHVREKVALAIKSITALIEAKVTGAKVEDRWTNAQVKAINEETRRRLQEVSRSAYFSKCVVEYDDTKEVKELYFGKFSFPYEKIYSWITPAGSIRFDNPGKISYTLPNGKEKTGTMLSKEQFSITEEKIGFYSIEELGKPRELIHQEHFSQHKAGFVLPEIVSQMEKAQDTFIRASYKGSFVISGPAGSGKTTLALHRIAYLMQSPQTTELFPDQSILVLVQDEGAKEYFSTLLPSLGINSVAITTFTEWAAKVVGVEGYTYKSQYIENDAYEFKKVKALRNTILPKYSKSTFTYLENVYGPFFDDSEKEIFKVQKKSKTLDRIDLTVLLTAFMQTYNKLSVLRTYSRVDSGGDMKTRSTAIKLEYSLIMVDEFQNYLPEQIKLFKKCIDHNTQSLMYIGDMKQQVRVGTMQNWESVSEYFDDKRQVKLEKVYRNTKEIVEYIQSLGFPIDMPQGIKSGKPVQTISGSENEITEYINSLIKEIKTQETIGVIVSSGNDCDIWKSKLASHDSLHILTARQSQGLEFDRVCIIHKEKESEKNDISLDPEFMQEKEKINKDLLYVALTRAMSELYVLNLK